MPSLHWPLPTTSSTRSTRSASHLRRRSGWSLPASYVPTISENLLNFLHYKQSNLLSLSLFFPYFHFSIKYNLQMCHTAGFLTAVNCWNVKWATRVQDVATVTKVGSKILTHFHFWIWPTTSFYFVRLLLSSLLLSRASSSLLSVPVTILQLLLINWCRFEGPIICHRVQNGRWMKRWECVAGDDDIPGSHRSLLLLRPLQLRWLELSQLCHRRAQG